ncbi:DNA double-strand break repair protein Rad50, partial ['Planchonia careya' phytoplasma]|nr:DNA double-strand break repair protein Rad50 ['Planchonia careya' phytoplasma]
MKNLQKSNSKKKLYQSLKLKYREMHNRMLTYETENKLSVGNMVKWGFKAFDNLIDLIPAKFGLKSIGKTVTFTLKFGQGMAKTTLILHEGHR